LGGASAVGGVGLGYEHGISGMWMVGAIGIGIIILSLAFAPLLQKLKIYTVVQMLTLRYGHESTQGASLVMLAYTMMICATSTGAYASIFVVLFDWDRWLSVLVGGSVVLIYSVIGGMFSITLADVVQFVVMTVGLFFLMLPYGLNEAGGWSGMQERLDTEFFSIDGIGLQSIITYFVVYTLGILIGQDIWQRVFTGRTPGITRWGGFTAGIYILAFGIAGAIVGMTVASMDSGIENRDDVFSIVAIDILPYGLGGIAMAGGIAAMMSTASGGLIASATVARTDVMPLLRSFASRKRPGQLSGREAAQMARENVERSDDHEADVKSNRRWVFGLGVAVMALALVVPDVVAALTIAYAILVGGLLVPIIGAMTWRRGTGIGAAWSMLAGTVVTLGTMIYLEITAENALDGVFANEPIYFGLLASIIVFIVGSLLSKPTPEDVWQAWKHRSRHGIDESNEIPAVVESSQ
ncbi:MAG: sodium:solute symporter, partial [Yaniella sp.]